MRISVRNTCALVLSLSACMAGQTAVSQEKTVKDGVFTAAQVSSGQMVYESSCKTCHNTRFYRDTLKSWDKQPLIYLWETIMGTMPADNPGSLGLDEYTDVIAYILSEQGFPAGEHKLDHNNGMENISIVAP